MEGLGELGKAVRLPTTKLLYHACECGDVGNVIHHLETGLSVDTPLDDDGNTLLAIAAANAQEEVLRLLLSRGASLDAPNSHGWTPLMQAARHGNSATLALLVGNKADLHASSHVGTTILMCAVTSADVQTVKVLLEAGLDLSFSAKASNTPNRAPTPLSLAASLGHHNVVRLLLDRGADPDRAHEPTDLTPLMLASMNGHLETVKILIDYGANPNLRDILGHTALEYATSRLPLQGELESFLKDRTSYIRTPGNRQESRRVKADIIEAARHGDLPRIRELLKDDANLANLCSRQDGATPLIYASVIGRLDIVKELVAIGANLNVQDTVTGWTALMQATFKGNKEVVKFLIEAGADVDVQAKNGATAFTLATTIDDADTEMVRLVASKQSLTKNGNSIRMGKSRNASTIAWAPPSNILSKESDMEITSHYQEGSHLDRLSSWWSRMSNRFRNLKLGRTFRLAPMPIQTNAASNQSSNQITPISSSIEIAPNLLMPSEFSHCKPMIGSLPIDNNNISVTGNLSLRSLSSGYESLILDSSGKPQLTLDLPSSNHPKLNNDLLKPVIPPFHMPPGFEPPLDDLFQPPFASSSSSVESGVFLSRGTGRVISGTATSPMPPGRTSKPVAKLFANANHVAQRNPSPSSSLLSNSGGGGTPSPHSSGGASSVSAVLRTNNTMLTKDKTSNAQNSSLLMSSGDSSTLTAGSDQNCKSIASSPGLTAGSSTISAKSIGGRDLSGSRDSLITSSRGLSFLQGYRATLPTNASSRSFLPSVHVPSFRQSARSHDSRESGTLTPTPSVYAKELSDSKLKLEVAPLHSICSKPMSVSQNLNNSGDIDCSEVTEAIVEPAGDDLGALLSQLSLERYQPIFEEQEVDIEAFMTLTNDDLQELGIDAFPAREQILAAIQRLTDANKF